MINELNKASKSNILLKFNIQSLQTLTRLIQGYPQAIKWPVDQLSLVQFKAKVVFLQGKNVHLGRIWTVLWS